MLGIYCMLVTLPLSLRIASGERFERQSFPGYCVPYYQCNDGKIDSWGTGNLDERFGPPKCNLDGSDNTCEGVDVCCMPDDADDDHHAGTTSNPLPPYNPDQQTQGYPDHHKPGTDERLPSENPSGFEHGEPVMPPGLNGCGLRRLNPLDPRIDTAIRITGKDDKPENTFYGEFPWMIAVFAESHGKKNFTCGGSLIEFDVVLTAAHCVEKLNGNQIVVRAGDWDSRTDAEPIPHQDRKVGRVVIHEDFDGGNLRNDIALLFLEKPFIQTKTIDTICVPKENSFRPENCYATGWGMNSFKDRGRYQPILKKVHLPLIDRAICQQKLRTTRLGAFFKLHKSFICAGGQVSEDTCTGDGGGPLVCANFEENLYRYAQVGIVSWGIDCGKENPAVYASVSHFHDWIKKNIG